MFNGAMDPEMFRIAQEQISRMSPAELARIQQQMMSNPDLVKMASESMENFSTEDLKYAAEQFKHTRPEEMAEIGEKMASATPEELAAMRAHANAQISYEISGAEILKKQGNELHGQGKYHDALQKYLLAKKNLKGVPSARAKPLLLACSLNLMSCYLKTKQYDDCIKEGSEVLASDPKNVKALYRRGQAYKETGQYKAAISDLSKAHEMSPDVDTIPDVLRDAKKRLEEEEEGGARTVTSTGLVIEEITEEDETSSQIDVKSASEYSVTQPGETGGSSEVQNENVTKRPSTNAEALRAMEGDPGTIRSFQDFISNTDPETLARVGGGGVSDVPPDMLKTAKNMISRMSPEELQKMIKLATSFEGDNSVDNRSPSAPDFGPGSVPANMTPETIKAAGDMLSKMSPDELQKMVEMASTLKQRHSSSTTTSSSSCLVPPDMTPEMIKAAGDMMSKMSPDELKNMVEMASTLKQRHSSSTTSSSSSEISSDSGSKLSELQENVFDHRDTVMSESSSSFPPFFSSRGTSQPTSTIDLQDQMKNQLNDPAMRQMLTSMMKNMSPETMASMGEQFGVKLSREDAEKAQQAMASLSPEDLDRMMRWGERIQRGVECARKTKNWLLGRPGMILAICMLILAMILHRLGFIGS